MTSHDDGSHDQWQPPSGTGGTGGTADPGYAGNPPNFSTGGPGPYDQHGQGGQGGQYPPGAPGGPYGPYEPGAAGGPYGPAGPGGGWAPGQYADAASAYGPAPGHAPGAFLLAPKPGIVPLRPLGIFEVIGGAFEALRANPRAMFLPALVVMSVIGLISAIISYSASTYSQIAALDSLSQADAGSTEDFVNSMAQLASLSMLGTLVTTLLPTLASTVLTGLIIVAVSRSVLGRVAPADEVWARVRPRVGALIGQSLLTSLVSILIVVVCAGAFALIVVAVVGSNDAPTAASVGTLLLSGLLILLLMLALSAFFMTRFYLASAALVLENVGVMEGIRRSWSLTGKNFWRVLGTIILTAILTWLLISPISFVVGVVNGSFVDVGGNAYAMTTAITTFVSSVVEAVVLPLSAAVCALTYIDARMRDEGLDVELRRAAGL